MYFVEREEKQCEITGVTVKEGKVYLFRFRGCGTIKWTHALVEELGENTITVRPSVYRPQITILKDDISAVIAAGEDIPRKLNTGIMKKLLKGEIYSESENIFVEGDK